MIRHDRDGRAFNFYRSLRWPGRCAHAYSWCKRFTNYTCKTMPGSGAMVVAAAVEEGRGTGVCASTNGYGVASGWHRRYVYVYTTYLEEFAGVLACICLTALTDPRSKYQPRGARARARSLSLLWFAHTLRIHLESVPRANLCRPCETARKTNRRVSAIYRLNFIVSCFSSLQLYMQL